MSEVAGTNHAEDAIVPDASDPATSQGAPATETKADTSVKVIGSDQAPGYGNQDRAMPDVADRDVDGGDSEAETLIQSPEKQRPTDNGSTSGSARPNNAKDEDSANGATATDTDNHSRKRKRSSEDGRDETTFTTSSRRSSPLSSPRLPLQSAESDSDASANLPSRKAAAKRRNPPLDRADSDGPDEKPFKAKTRIRRPSDILPPISKHRTKRSDSGVDPASERRETRSATYPRQSSQERSPSPAPPARREHRRGVSTQFTVGDVERKKRGRPPAIQTRSGSAELRRRSVSSADSDSPQQSRPALHKFSSADNDNMSPAKANVGPRKWRDKNGRTYLSRACNNNDLATARAKLAERPEDLNEADNAGNTPLQIAALEGFADIVKFLLEKGCDVDTRNIDRETPLIDAVENGHLEVVRLLLAHGANPRLGNAKGDEPYELVPAGDENYEAIRKLLADAKENSANRHVSSDHNEAIRDEHSSRAASAASPRDSPPIIGPRSPPTLASRRRTGRSESTRNDLLWQASTQENLIRLAAKGDVQGVANILNILQKAETESLIAAAKAGHEEVLQYLLGMGDPEADPEPLRNLKPGYNTPILAAIGRGHPEVVKLLVEQSGFNPTRRVLKGKTYFDVAAERKGDEWQKEYDILKDAFDKYASGKVRKPTSPRLTRDAGKAKMRVIRRSHSPPSGKTRSSASSSPALAQKSLPTKSPRLSHKDRARESGSVDAADRHRHPSAKKETAESSVAVSSDHDQSIAAPRKTHTKRRSQSDLPPPPNLDLDATHRRRRLVTGKEHRRRKSIVEEDSSDDGNDVAAIKTENKPGTTLKRGRDSVSPSAAAPDTGENSRGTAKKRRTLVVSSPEEVRAGTKRKSQQPPTPTRDRRGEKTPHDEDGAKRQKRQKMDLPASDALQDSKNPGPASADQGADEPDQVPAHGATELENRRPSGEAAPLQPIKEEPVEIGPSEAELERQRQEAAHEQAAREQAAREQAAREQAAGEQAAREEAAREEAAREEAAREAAAREAAESKRLEEEKAAAEKALEEQRRLEEIERRKKAEEEAALRRREEEERQERIKRELEERQRRQEEQLRLQRIELERRRREALPIVLAQTALMIDNNDPLVRSVPWLSKYLPLFTVRTVQLQPDVPDAIRDELWVPNYQVAGLLVTKDLNLRNYTSLEKRPVVGTQRDSLWKVSRMMLSYDYETNGLNTTVQKAVQVEERERPKFLAMEELFWVKLSDFQDQVFRHPHLANIPLRQQPISLRVITRKPTVPQPTLSNGVVEAPKLSNGINPHSTSPPAFGNGYTR